MAGCTSTVYAPSPPNIQVSVDTAIRLRIALSPAVLVKLERLLSETPDALSVTWPVPFCTMAEENGEPSPDGMVSVTGEELLKMTILPLSVDAKV